MPGATRCWAYKEDGTICGAEATGFAFGVTLCDEHFVSSKRGKSAKELARNIEEWQKGFDHFTARLFSLIAKADIFNRERLREGFPNEVAAYEAWLCYGVDLIEDPEQFIKKWQARLAIRYGGRCRLGHPIRDGVCIICEKLKLEERMGRAAEMKKLVLARENNKS